jgi:hypothetical protein
MLSLISLDAAVTLLGDGFEVLNFDHFLFLPEDFISKETAFDVLLFILLLQILVFLLSNQFLFLILLAELLQVLPVLLDFLQLCIASLETVLEIVAFGLLLFENFVSKLKLHDLVGESSCLGTRSPLFGY